MSEYVAMSYVCANTCNDVGGTSSVEQPVNRQCSICGKISGFWITFALLTTEIYHSY